MSQIARHRADANHVEIANAFRGQGATVFSAHSIGNGFPDLVIGYGGRTELVEIKRPLGPKGGGEKRSALTPAQIEFRTRWRGAPVHVVRTLPDVRALLDAIAGL